MSVSQRIIKNTFYLYTRMIVSILVNIFTTRVLLTALGASDYGLYNVVGGSIAMLGFITASMSGATQRFLSYAEGKGDKERIKEIFVNSLIVHYGIALITVLLLIFSGFILFNGVLNIPEGRKVAALFIYCCMIFSTIFSIIVVPYDASLNAHENMRFYSLIGISDILFKFIIAVGIYYWHSDRLILYSILMAVESWLVRVIILQYCKAQYEECQNICYREYHDKQRILEMVSFAGWNLLESISNMIAFYGMGIVANHFFGTEINAALGITFQLSGVLMGVSLSLMNSITPVLVKKEGGHKRNEVIEMCIVGCKFSYLLLLFVCLPIIFYIDDLLNIWLTKVPLWTEIFCRIFLISNLLEQFTRLLYQAILAQGNIREYNIIRSMANVISLIASVLMFTIGNFSPYWVLLNWMLWRAMIGGMINIYYANLNLGLPVVSFFKRVICTCLVVTLAFFVLDALLFWWKFEYEINVVIVFSLSFIVAIPIYWYVGVTQREKKKILQFLYKKSPIGNITE